MGTPWMLWLRHPVAECRKQSPAIDQSAARGVYEREAALPPGDTLGQIRPSDDDFRVN